MPRPPVTPDTLPAAIRELSLPSTEHESAPGWVTEADLDLMETTRDGLWALYRLAHVVQDDGSGESEECAQRLSRVLDRMAPELRATLLLDRLRATRAAPWSEWAPLFPLLGGCGSAWAVVLPELTPYWRETERHGYQEQVRQYALRAAARLLPAMPDDRADALRSELVHPDSPAHQWSGGYEGVLAEVALDARSYRPGSRSRQEIVEGALRSPSVMRPVLDALVRRGAEGPTVRRIVLCWWDQTGITRAYFPEVLERVAHSGLPLLTQAELLRLGVHPNASIRALLPRLAAVTVPDVVDVSLPRRR